MVFACVETPHSDQNFGIIPLANAIVDTQQVACQYGLYENLLVLICDFSFLFQLSKATTVLSLEILEYEDWHFNMSTILQCNTVPVPLRSVGTSVQPRLF